MKKLKYLLTSTNEDSSMIEIVYDPSLVPVGSHDFEEEFEEF